ncbi:hypothetical protein EDD29_5558 [Actinocorallia herbida]|uniref:Uncharacterized protein n=1 Tax=Actinocorallia herbida TaxID=58109 RepID=A0A3N1D338_9ACTN|nr:hypothetical protein [Actinocorallia herbida]ROO87910.1 hypothetical protein EDD29_5558 [Actinocorallia herbida]
MKLRAGQQLVSAVDTTKLIVVRAPGEEVTVTCAGVAMHDPAASAPEGAAADPAQQDGSALGKRYADEALGIELLCTKAGTGTLAVNGAPLALQGAKALPASD